jgi:1-acyl-sn-glycerol-3-phosphate acyltransferase
MKTPPQDKSKAQAAGQFSLLKTRRFAPFFWTQLCGAFNDNLFNALFMVASSATAGLLPGVLDLSLQQFFGLLAAGNLVVCAYILRIAPLFPLRILAWALTRAMYRVRCHGLQNIPSKGAAVLVCNHVSYLDALIIAGSCRRPIRFVMHDSYYHIPVLKHLFRLARVIPIASGKRHPGILRRAMAEIDAALHGGELVCLFPEGRLTRTGTIGRFRPGIERIVRSRPVPVVPLALRGLWGSVFSQRGGPAMRRRFRRFRSAVDLVAAPFVAAPQVTSEHLQATVEALHCGKTLPAGRHA